MSFIKTYLDFSNNTKPAVQFHIWTMLSVLSVAAGRRFWFPFGRFVYYPHIYTVFVGDPGCGKSTAMDMGKNLIRDADIRVPIAATKMTKEALSQEMAHEKFIGRKFFQYQDKMLEYNQYAIFATELTQFISVDPLGFMDFLTTIWSEPVFEVKTKHQGNDYINAPYITLCACMTPELVKGFLKMNILQGGFARRAAFVFSATKNIVHIPEDPPAHLRAQLIDYIRLLQTRSGQFTWTDELKDFYIQWNQKNEETIRDRPPNTRGWYESLGELLFKLSMLICLAESDSLVLDIPHYKIALSFVDMVNQNLDRVFEGTGINPNASAAAQICRMLEALDRPMDKKKLLAMFFDQARSINDLVDTINHLISVGRLAARDICIQGQLIGTAIATPECLREYSDVQLAILLRPSLVPPPETSSDSSQEAGPS